MTCGYCKVKKNITMGPDKNAIDYTINNENSATVQQFAHNASELLLNNDS
jgi:hypothetical protein